MKGKGKGKGLTKQIFQ